MEENENHTLDLPIAETSQVSFHPLSYTLEIFEKIFKNTIPTWEFKKNNDDDECKVSCFLTPHN